MIKLQYVLLLLGLTASNASGQSSGTPKQLPYECDFSTSEQFQSEWTVSNNNEDYNTWEFSDQIFGSDGTTGCAGCVTNSVMGNDDYLISSALSLEAGDNNVSFDVRGVRADGPEVLELCIGKTEDTGQMTTLRKWTINSADWLNKTINFKVEETGTYHLALHSLSKNGFSTYVDNFKVNKGAANLTPDLKIESIKTPYSQCDFSDKTTIGAVIKNMGNGAADEYTLTYSINGGTPVTEHFNDAIASDARDTVFFQTQADMAATGEYKITVQVTCEGTTNESSTTITHNDPITQLPSNADFSNGESDDWIQHTAGSWTYDQMGQCISTNKTGVDNGLYSRCIQADVPLRIKFAYSGGMFVRKGAIKILLGLSGTDISEWRTIYEDKDVNNDGAEKEISVSDMQPGTYSIAVINEAEEIDIPLNLYYINVSGIYNRDLKATEARTPIAAYMPVEQWNSKGKYAVSVENRGTEAVANVTTSMNIGDKKCFASDQTINLNPGDTATVLTEGTMPKHNIGDVIKGAYIAVDAAGEKYAADNRIEFEDIMLTDTVFATENIDEFIKGIGMSYQTAKFGNVYTLNAADTLTSVTLGLAADEYYVERNIGISVYTVGEDGHSIGRKLFSTVTERGSEGGLRTFSFAPRVLKAGSYYVEADQMTTDNIGISNDPDDKQAVFYQSDGQKLYPITGSGSIALRMNFGHNATAYEKNISLTKFTAPLKDKGLYGAADSVAVMATNNGSEAIEKMKVTCSVDGTEVAQTTISLLPYETTEIKFHGIDLTAEGERNITVTALLDGDEQSSDNSISRTITAVAEANPYKLDFEQCDDFDYGTMFNPRWRTVDRVGKATNEWSYYDYPHRGEPVGFMAFNTEKTTPVFTTPEGFRAHSGQRFGAAFATLFETGDEQSDVWLISPKLQLKSGSKLNLFVKTYGIEYYNKPERYRLLVSDTDDAFDSFKVIGGDCEASADAWEEVSVDLSAYDNKAVYVALQYISTSAEGVVMMVDDIEVKTGTSGINANTIGGKAINITKTGGDIVVNADCELTSVKVFNVSGAQVYASDGTNSQSLTISASAMKPGLYIVKATTAEGEATAKLKL